MTAGNSQFDINHWLYRFLAIFIDGIIIGAIIYVIYYWGIAPLLWPRTTIWGVTVSAEPVWSSWLLYPLISGLVWLIYSVALDVTWGATVGKRVLGLRVQTVNGAKLDAGTAVKREISKIFWIILLLDWILGIATPGPDRRQRYFDRIAGTTVVSTKQPFGSASASYPPPPPPPPPP